MKVVKMSISLPEDVWRLVRKNAARQAKERGSTRNTSQYICEVLAKEKRRVEMSEAA